MEFRVPAIWRDPGAPADSFYEVRPECTDVPKTRFRIKVRIVVFLSFLGFWYFLGLMRLSMSRIFRNVLFWGVGIVLLFA